MIAFCFLTINNIENEYLWFRYFKKVKKEYYNIYINSKHNVKSVFKKNTLNPSHPTKSKSDISIVEATLFLLEKAYHDNPENQYFVFLCGTCMPLITFNELYTKISHMKYSVIKEFPNNRKDRYHQLSSKMKSIYKYDKFTKQHPNMILTRNDVEFFIQNKELIQHFNKMECPDEHYFINVMRMVRREYYNHQIMFCNYNTNNTQALNFNLLDLNLIKLLKEKEYYFIRKINKKFRIT